MTTIRDAYEITSKASTAGINAATSALKAMGNVSFGALKAGLQGVMGVGGKLLGFLGQLPQQFFFLQQMLMSLGGAFKSLIQAAALVSPALGVELAQLSADLARLKDTALAAFGKTLTPLLHAVGLAMEDKRFQHFAEVVIGGVNGALGKLSGMITKDVLPKFLDLLPRLEQASKSFTWFFDRVKSGQASFTDLGTVVSIIGRQFGAPDWLTGGIDKILRFAEAVRLFTTGDIANKARGSMLLQGIFGDGQTFKAVQTGLDWITGRIPTLISAVRELTSGDILGKAKGRGLLFSALGDLLSTEQVNAVQSAIEGNLGPTFALVGQWISTQWETTVKPFVTGLWPKFKDWLLGTETSNVGANGEREQSQRVGGVIQGLVSALGAAGNDPSVIESLKGNGSSLGGSIMNGIAAFLGGVAELVKLLVEIAARFYTALQDPQVQAGLSNIGKALAGGIISGAKAALDDIGKMLPDWAKGAVSGAAGGAKFGGAGVLFGALGGAITSGKAPDTNPEDYLNFPPIPGLASGGSFTVPSGYERDNFLARFSSGEHVTVTRAGDEFNRGGDTIYITSQRTENMYRDEQRLQARRKRFR